jgi:hypothetical protein
MKSILIPFLILTLFVAFSCRKEEPGPDYTKKITITGILTDSFTGTPVRDFKIERFVCHDGHCWSISGIEECIVCDATHTSSKTDSLGRFTLTIAKDSVKSGNLSLRVIEFNNFPYNFNFSGGTENVMIDVTQDIIEHDMKVKILPNIIVSLEDDPTLDFLPNNVPWKCYVKSYTLTPGTRSVTFNNDLTLQHQRDTFLAAGYDEKLGLSWAFLKKDNYQVLKPEEIDTIYPKTNGFVEYIIKY